VLARCEVRGLHDEAQFIPRLRWGYYFDVFESDLVFLGKFYYFDIFEPYLVFLGKKYFFVLNLPRGYFFVFKLLRGKWQQPSG